MDRNNSIFALTTINSSLAEFQVKDKILSCNKETEKFGLTLNEQQALALADTRARSLKETQRIELNGFIVDKIILAFYDSPYLEKHSYEDTLHGLIALFYDLKDLTWDTISDNDLIDFMKNAFNAYCYGSIDLLYSESLKLSEHVHCGGNINTYKTAEE